MAVPKKRTSRTKTKTRKALWFKKAILTRQKAWSFACSIAKDKSKFFIPDKPPKKSKKKAKRKATKNKLNP